MEYRVDFHIHSSYSADGVMRIGTIFDRALRKGLRAVAVADHNTFEGSYEALAKERGDLAVIPAVEASTDFGHMLCYFVARGPADAGLKMKNGVFRFDEIRDYIAGENGLLFAAHPYRKSPPKIEGVLEALHGIEVFNGRNTARRQAANDRARQLAADHGLCFTAGSDAHLPGEVGRAYRIFSFDHDPDLQEIRSAMLVGHGRYYGCYSPLFYEGISGVVHDLRQKDGRRLAKDLAKTAVGGMIDPVCGLREDTRHISRGRVYRLPDGAPNETELK